MNIEVNQQKTLLHRIEGSLGSLLFRTVFAQVDGVETDILRDGQVSCAVYVSGLLVWAEVLTHLHATVSSLEKGLQSHGWVVTDTPVPGSVIIWEAVAQVSGELHEHAGFAINATEAVSHSDKERTPVRHHITYGVGNDGSPARSIKCIYTHEILTSGIH